MLRWWVAATALVSIGLLGGEPDAHATAAGGSLVRWATAVATARVRGDAAEQGVVDELLAWAGSDREADDRIPFLDGDLAGYAGLALGQIGARHTDATFDALLARLPAISGTDAMSVVGEALRLAFPDGPASEGTGIAALSDRQRRLVLALVAAPGTWQINGMTFGNFALMVAQYGLPSSHDEMREYARNA